MSEQWIWTDAHRRVCIAKQRGENNRARMWVGLGPPSAYKSMMKRGYMKPLDDFLTPRVANWFLFTEAGWAEYDRRYKDKRDFFDPAFNEVW
jgi:hypothetical protein